MRIKYVSRKLDESQKPDVQKTHNQTATVPSEPSRPVVQRFLEWMGMPQISDEEYLKKLKLKREDILKQIAEIEAERAKASKDSNEEKSHPP